MYSGGADAVDEQTPDTTDRIGDLERRLQEAISALDDARQECALRERLSLLGQIAVGIGHELRQPLSVVNSAAYCLRAAFENASGGDVSAVAAAAPHLNRLDQQIAEANRIITALMDYARTQQPRRRALDLNQLVEQEAVKLLAPEHTRCIRQLASGALPVMADPLHVERVFHILVANAFESLECPEGAASGEVCLRTFAEPHLAVLEVKDTGVGVPDDLREKIFKPFFSNKSKGLGLGLALARQLIEANSGNICFSSKVRCGSIFQVRLPSQ